MISNKIRGNHPRLSPPGVFINADGLLTNNLLNLAGRGNYFPSSAGTSEGQFLMIRAAALAYQRTNDIRWYTLLLKLLSNLPSTYYQNRTTSHLPWGPHWLMNVKSPFVSETFYYNSIFTFVNGVATIPQGTPHYGELVRQVFHARSLDSTYLWENPYSGLATGTQYPVASFTQNSPTDTTVTLVDTGINGDLYIMYSTITGPIIEVNEPFEAWPGWRELDVGETNIAVDTMAWALDAFNEAYIALGDVTYDDMATATKNSMETVYIVDDGRAWITTGYIPPTGLSGSFIYNEITPLPTLSRNNVGEIFWSIPTPVTHTGSSIVQYGRGGLGDAWQTSDSVEVQISLTVPQPVTIFIDNSVTVNASTRFMTTITPTGTGMETFVIPRTDFKDNFGAGSNVPAIGSPLLTVGIQLIVTTAVDVVVHSVRPIPYELMPYTPGLFPFTANLLGSPAELITWRGPAYSGYQAPWVWPILGTTGAINNCLTFLKDAQQAYTTALGIEGPFAPVYILPRYDDVVFDTPNTFTWTGPDPNTKWGGYQYRPLEATARYWAAYPSDTLARDIVMLFLTWISNTWTSSDQFPPTDFPVDSFPTSTYNEPHFVALILRSAMWADLAGGSQSLTRPLILQCLLYLNQHYTLNGPMAGTFVDNGDSYFGFWNGEIIAAICLMLNEGSTILADVGFPSDTLYSWLSGNVNWLKTVTLG